MVFWKMIDGEALIEEKEKKKEKKKIKKKLKNRFFEPLEGVM